MTKKEKRESWIEKVLPLLNEFETPKSWVVFQSYDDYDGTFYGVDCDGETEIAGSDSMILSKRFGFVEWLVENKKINRWRIENNQDYAEYLCNLPIEEYGVEILLMLFAIADEPIDYLCNILR